MARDLTADILDAAAELAEQGGFDEVRLRDVAKRANVALATVYKRFPSKEALLAADVARRTEELEARLLLAPPAGDTAAERLAAYFAVSTRVMTDKPGYGRSVIRAMASGPAAAQSVIRHQGRVVMMTLAALRGVPTLDFRELGANPLTEREQTQAFLLMQYWFATLVGWSAGLNDVAAVDAQMKRIIDVVLRGT
jgi:AcrR family transcriptional regulator